MKLFCFGVGYCGASLAAQLLRCGWKVAGTCRSEEKAAQLRAAGIEAFVFGGKDSPLADPAAALADVTHVLCTIPPTSDSDVVVTSHRRDLMQPASMPHVTWIGYLSVTSVYGNVDGAWVDETSAVNAITTMAKNRLLAEEQWRDISSTRGVHLSVFRIAAIYDRSGALYDRVRSGTAQRVNKPGYYCNWIHSDDIVQIVMAAMNHKHDQNVAIYNVADDEPMPSRDVIEYMCDLLEIKCPPLLEFEEFKSAAHPMLIAFYNQSRRVRNDKIKRVFGVKLLYPSVKHFVQQKIKQKDN